MKDAFNGLLDFLAKHLEMETPEVAEDGLCVLQIGEQPICIKWLPQAGNALILADLGPIPEHGREAFYERLLKANHALFETGGTALSANRDMNMVALQYMAPVELLDGQRFLKIMENFVAVAVRWRGECAGFAGEPVRSEPSRDFGQITGMRV
jgi:hypothetical protein